MTGQRDKLLHQSTFTQSEKNKNKLVRKANFPQFDIGVFDSASKFTGESNDAWWTYTEFDDSKWTGARLTKLLFELFSSPVDPLPLSLNELIISIK